MAPRHGTKGMMTVIQVQEPLQSEHRAILGDIHKIHWVPHDQLLITLDSRINVVVRLLISIIIDF